MLAFSALNLLKILLNYLNQTTLNPLSFSSGLRQPFCILHQLTLRQRLYFKIQIPYVELFSIALAIFKVTFASIQAAITIRIIEIKAKVRYSLTSSFVNIVSFLPAKYLTIS